MPSCVTWTSGGRPGLEPLGQKAVHLPKFTCSPTAAAASFNVVNAMFTCSAGPAIMTSSRYASTHPIDCMSSSACCACSNAGCSPIEKRNGPSGSPCQAALARTRDLTIPAGGTEALAAEYHKHNINTGEQKSTKLTNINKKFGTEAGCGQANQICNAGQTSLPFADRSEEHTSELQ